jgi:exopolysaccharide production protein ExoQ
MTSPDRTFFEKSLLFFLLVLATGAGLGAYIAKQEGGAAYAYSGGNHVIQLIFSSVYLYFFFRLAQRGREAWALVKQEKWIAAYWMWALASSLWSASTSLTVVHWIALLGTGLVGLYMALNFEPLEQLSLIARCLATVAIASLIAALVVPSIGVAQGGAWQGVFFPKNSLGRMMALGTFSFVLLAIDQKNKRWLNLLMAGSCCALLFLAQSATAIVVCALMLTLLPFRKMLAMGNRLLVPLLVFLSMFTVPLVVWLAMNSKAVLTVLGRDSSLTGRLPLWSVVLQEIATRPFAGFGYGAFWSTAEADRVRATIGWAAPNAHNGFLEILLALGLIGGALFLIGLLRNLALAVRAVRSGGRGGESWPFFFLMFNLFYSMTESSLLSANFILSMLFVANSYWVVRASTEEYVTVEDESEEMASDEPLYCEPAEV